MTVFWRDAARADIARLTRFIATENPVAAQQVARELVLAGDSLVVFPHRGRHGRLSGTRELVAYRPYILVYRVNGNGDVTIVRVWHGAQSRADAHS
ncbi:MAG TPA: type II toxin-antitoxin system RelE/ParE family toxin [Roseateles sp.]|nr:type II toxin-antitoxin system RelE/ParE family toxin [Roseateles sp.]